jgi:hypothetical protein
VENVVRISKKAGRLRQMLKPSPRRGNSNYRSYRLDAGHIELTPVMAQTELRACFTRRNFGGDSRLKIWLGSKRIAWNIPTNVIRL